MKAEAKHARRSNGGRDVAHTRLTSVSAAARFGPGPAPGHCKTNVPGPTGARPVRLHSVLSHVGASDMLPKVGQTTTSSGLQLEAGPECSVW